MSTNVPFPFVQPNYFPQNYVPPNYFPQNYVPPQISNIPNKKPIMKIVVVIIIIIVVIIIIGVIIYSIFKGKTNYNSNESDPKIRIVTESVNVTKNVVKTNSVANINTSRVVNKLSSNLSVTDEKTNNSTTLYRKSGTKLNYDPPTNENYILATQFICDDKQLLGSMSLDEGIDKCNDCLGVQRIGSYVFMCKSLLSTTTIPDDDVWINKNKTNLNSFNNDIKYIPTGDKLLYNKYNNYKFNYSNLERLSEPSFWNEAINLCNKNDRCIGVEYNGPGNNSIPFKVIEDPPILMMTLMIYNSSSDKLIYIKNKILSSDTLPTVSNPLKDIITLP